jgi:hypothetical protein
MSAASKKVPAEALRLYRQVLRIHRERLPPPMRALGDQYARDEWRRHRSANTTKQQWQTFMQEWQKYNRSLLGQADLSARTGELPEDVLASMTPEQKQQLERLKQETAALGGALSNLPPSH